ncbi:hypothetical protein AGMMS50268_09840 [Spirochaetia bacterium]|nr:hypothetical protein AGMMS50268_09840 [Spirochaetia bacterium]
MNEREATNYSDGMEDFSEEAYAAFLERKKSLQITNSRKRPDGVPLIDELVKEQKRFCATPEGKHFMNFIATSLKESISSPAAK